MTMCTQSTLRAQENHGRCSRQESTIDANVPVSASICESSDLLKDRPILVIRAASESQVPDDLGLAGWGNRSVARKRGHHTLVPQILTPRLVFLWRSADALAKLDQRFPDAVGIEVGQSGGDEGVVEHRADRGRVAPVPAIDAR